MLVDRKRNIEIFTEKTRNKFFHSGRAVIFHTGTVAIGKIIPMSQKFLKSNMLVNTTMNFEPVPYPEVIARNTIFKN